MAARISNKRLRAGIRADAGFSLIELAIGVLLFALFAGMAADFGSRYLATARISSTADKMRTLADKLELFYQEYQRYPCPARGNLLPGDPNYGVEVSGCTCPMPIVTGITCTANAAIGAVPFNTLRLSEESGFLDAWDNKITYAVTGSFTQKWCGGPGGITVRDVTNVDTVTANAVFALVSHGQDGKGAWLKSGARSPCGTVGLDINNCNYTSGGASIFVDAGVNNLTAGANYYDDVMVWRNNRFLQTCPAGVNGCTAWYDAGDVCSVSTTVVSGTPNYDRITQWNDKSPNAYHLTGLGLGTDPAYTQAYNGDSPDSTNPNGRAVVRFSAGGHNSDMLFNGSVPFAVPETIIAVSRVNGFVAGQAVYACLSVLPCFQLYLNGSMSISSSGTPAADANGAAASPGIYYLTRAVFNGTNSTLIVNRGMGTSPTAIGSNSATGLIVGKAGSSLGGYLNGDVAEIVIYNRVLSDFEASAIEMYLAKKWGIPLKS